MREKPGGHTPTSGTLPVDDWLRPENAPAPGSTPYRIIKLEKPSLIKGTRYHLYSCSADYAVQSFSKRYGRVPAEIYAYKQPYHAMLYFIPLYREDIPEEQF